MVQLNMDNARKALQIIEDLQAGVIKNADKMTELYESMLGMSPEIDSICKEGLETVEAYKSGVLKIIGIEGDTLNTNPSLHGYDNYVKVMDKNFGGEN